MVLRFGIGLPPSGSVGGTGAQRGALEHGCFAGGVNAVRRSPDRLVIMGRTRLVNTVAMQPLLGLAGGVARMHSNTVPDADAAATSLLDAECVA